jgi:hypothetical protein
MKRDLHSGTSAAVAIAAATLSADNTPPAVDLQGFDGAEIFLNIGVGGITFSGTNKVDFVVEHSNDGSAWAAVAQADIVGATVATGGIVRSLIAAKAAADVQEMSYIGGRRYVRCTADFSGTHGTGTMIGMFAILGRPNLSPVT